MAFGPAVTEQLVRWRWMNGFKGRALKGIFRILSMLGCCCLLVACNSLPGRNVPQAISITRTGPAKATNEYVFCDLKGGAWGCEDPSVKTPISRQGEIQPHQKDGYAILARRKVINASSSPVMTVFFEFNSATVSDEQVLEIVSLVKDIKDATRITVSGYTDNVGGERYNGFLAQRRASAVKRLLIENGIASDRIRAFGKGKCCYVDDNNLTSGRAKNRRVTISF